MPDIDLSTAAYRHLTKSVVPDILHNAGLLGEDSTNPSRKDFGPYYWDPANGRYGWIFTGLVGNRPQRDVENTGKCAIVFTSNSVWAAKSRNHSNSFPRLNVLIYADVSRDSRGAPAKQDAESKAKTIYSAISPLFHDSGKSIDYFDELPIVDSVEGIGFSLMEVPNGDGAVRGIVSYDVTLY